MFASSEQQGNTSSVNPLIKAIQDGNFSQVQRFVRDPQLLKQLDDKKNTPLHVAASKGNIDILNLLFPACKAFLDSRNSRGQLPIHLAAAGGDKAVIAALITQGADPNALDSEKRTPLHHAVLHRRERGVKQLLEHHANPLASDSRGETPLHLASSYGHLEIMRSIFHRAQGDSRRNYVQVIDHEGKTPLHCAAQSPDANVLEYLLKYGANPDAQTFFGYTAIFFAIRAAKPENVRVLLNHQASLFIDTVNYQTPVEYSGEYLESKSLASTLSKKNLKALMPAKKDKAATGPQAVPAAAAASASSSSSASIPPSGTSAEPEDPHKVIGRLLREKLNTLLQSAAFTALHPIETNLLQGDKLLKKNSSKEDLDKARDHYYAALKLARSQNKQQEEIIAWRKLCKLEQHKKDFPQAAKFLMAAEAIYYATQKFRFPYCERFNDGGLLANYRYELLKNFVLDATPQVRHVKALDALKDETPIHRLNLHSMRVAASKALEDPKANPAQVLGNNSQTAVQLFHTVKESGIAVLGPAPRHAGGGLGSWSRRELSTSSDVEFIFFTVDDNQETIDYFLRLTSFCEINFIFLGETEVKAFNLPFESPIRSGFSFDTSGGITPYGIKGEYVLIGTPRRLARFHELRYFDDWRIASNALKNVCFISGDEKLVEEYEKEKNKVLKREIEVPGGSKNEKTTLAKWQGLEMMRQELAYYSPQLTEQKEKQHQFHVKEEIYRIANCILNNLAVYYLLKAKNSWQRIDELVSRGKISQSAGEHLKDAMSRIARFRLKAHLHYGYEQEMMAHRQINLEGDACVIVPAQAMEFSEEDIRSLFEIFRVVIPFHREMKNFVEHDGKSKYIKNAKFYDDELTAQAQALERACKFQEAKDAYQKAKAANPNNTAIMVGFANMLGRLGDPANQREELERALRIHRSMNAKDKAGLLNILTSLISAYGALGQLDKQGELIQQAEELAIQFYGEKHIESAKVLAIKANWLGEKGQIKEQIALLQKIIHLLEQLVKPPHPLLAKTYASLGVALASDERFAESRDYIQRALQMDIQLFNGESHVAVAADYILLANTFGLMHDLQAKKANLEKALEIQEGIFGSIHPEVAITLNNLGNTNVALGNVPGGIELLQKALGVQKRVYKGKHPHVLITQINLAHAHGKMGQSMEQRQLLLESEKLADEVFSHMPDHPSAAEGYLNLGEAFLGLGEIETGIKLLGKSLSIRERIYAHTPYKLIATLFALAHGYGQQPGQKTRQQDLLMRVLGIQENIFGKAHHELVLTLQELAQVFADLGQYKIQIEYLSRALAILEMKEGEDSPKLVNVLLSLSSAHEHMQNGSQAKQFKERAERLKPTIIHKLNETQALYFDLSYWQQRRMIQEQKLSLQEQVYGKENENLLGTLQALCEVYQALGDLRKTGVYVERGISIIKAHPSADKNKSFACFFLNCSAEIALLLQDNEAQTRCLSELGQLSTQIEDKVTKAEVLIRVGRLHAARDPNFDHAVGFLQESHKIAKETNQTLLIIHTYLVLSQFYLFANRLDGAKQCADKALLLWQQNYEQSMHPLLGEIYLVCAQIYQARDKVQAAKEFAQKALKVTQTILPFDDLRLAYLLYQIADIAYSNGDYNECLQRLKEVEKILTAKLPSNHTQLTNCATDIQHVTGLAGNTEKNKAKHLPSLLAASKQISSSPSALNLSAANIASSSSNVSPLSPPARPERPPRPERGPNSPVVVPSSSASTSSSESNKNSGTVPVQPAAKAAATPARPLPPVSPVQPLAKGGTASSQPPSRPAPLAPMKPLAKAGAVAATTSSSSAQLSSQPKSEQPAPPSRQNTIATTTAASAEQSALPATQTRSSHQEAAPVVSRTTSAIQSQTTAEISGSSEQELIDSEDESEDKNIDRSESRSSVLGERNSDQSMSQSSRSTKDKSDLEQDPDNSDRDVRDLDKAENGEDEGLDLMEMLQLRSLVQQAGGPYSRLNAQMLDFARRAWVKDIRDAIKAVEDSMEQYDQLGGRFSPAFIKQLKIAFREVALEGSDDNDRTLLHWMVRHRDEEMVERLLVDYKFDVNAQDTNGWTPLHFAAYRGHLALTRRLLLAGADPSLISLKDYQDEIEENKTVKELNLLYPAGSKPRDIAHMQGYPYVVQLFEVFEIHKDKSKATREAALQAVCDVSNEPLFVPTDLASAVQCGDVAAARRYLQAGQDVNGKINENPYIVFAAWVADLQMCQLLIEFKADVRAVDGDKNPAIFYAVKYGLWPFFKLFIEQHKDKEFLKSIPGLLHAAAASKNLRIVEILLDYGLDINSTNDEGRTILYNAEGYIFEMLVRRGINVNHQDKKGDTFLHFCAVNDWEDNARLLLRAGADATIKNNDKKTAFQVAVETGNRNEICRLLLRYIRGLKADEPLPDRIDPNKDLLIAAERNNLEEVQNALKSLAFVDHPDKKTKWTALHWAVKHRNIKMCQLLLREGASVDAKSSKNWTPFYLAILDQWQEAIDLFMKANADIFIETSSQDQIKGKPLAPALCRGLTIARITGNTSLYKRLQEYAYQQKMRDKENTPVNRFIAAVRSYQLDKAKQALQEGASPNVMDGDWPILFYAIESQDIKLAALFKEAGADLMVEDKDKDFNGFDIAVRRCPLDMVQYLHSWGFNINRPRPENKATPLIGACYYNSLPVVRYLCQQGAELNATNNSGMTPLLAVCETDHIIFETSAEVGKFLLTQPSVNPKAKNFKNANALYITCYSGNEALFDELVKLKLPTDEENINGWTGLMSAVSCNFHKIAGKLIQLKARVNHKNKNGWSVLGVAIDNEAEESVKLLLDAGAKINELLNNNKTSALILASGRGNIKIVQHLLAQPNVDVDIKNHDDNGDEDRTALIAAVWPGHIEVIRLLLKANAEVNYHDRKGWSPLKIAARCGYAECADALLNHRGINPNFRMEDTRYTGSPLNTAADHDQVVVVKRLLRAPRIDINQQDTPFFGVPLTQAVSNGNIDTVRVLLNDTRIDTEQPNGDGRTALGLAKEKGYTEIEKLLLAKMANNTAQSDCPLVSAALRGDLAEIDRLLKAGEDVNQRNSIGDTALYAASKEGHAGVVKRLLQQQDIDVNSRNELRMHALYAACTFGHEEVVRLLLAHEKIDVNQTGQMYQTALAQACELGRANIVALLLSHRDIDPNIQRPHRGNDGCNPLEYCCENSFNGLSADYRYFEGDHFACLRLMLNHPKINPNIRRAYWCGHSSPLHLAVNYIEAARELLRHPKTHLNLAKKSGFSPLCQAAASNGEGIVSFLLTGKGIDPNFRTNEGQTPLILAAKNGKAGSVRVLIGVKSVLVNAADHAGKTALHYAAQEGNTKSLGYLLKASGLALDNPSREGETALMLAAKSGQEQAVKDLIAAGADTTVKNKDGYDARMLAYAKGFPKLGAMIKEAEDKRSLEKEAKDQVTIKQNLDQKKREKQDLVRQQSVANISIDEVRRIEREMKKLEEQENALQQSFTWKQWNSQALNYILSHPLLKEFYYTLQTKLNEVFVGYRSLEMLSPSEVESLTRHVQLLDKDIPLPNVKHVARRLVKKDEAADREAVKVESILNLIGKFNEMDLAIQTTARLITFIYEEQVGLLRDHALVKQLAEMAVLHLLNLLGAKDLAHKNSLFAQLHFALTEFDPKTGPLKVTERKLTTDLTDRGLFRQSGYRTADGTLYTDRNSKPEVYGYRLVEKEQVDQRHLEKRPDQRQPHALNNNPFLANESAAKQYQQFNTMSTDSSRHADGQPGGGDLKPHMFM